MEMKAGLTASSWVGRSARGYRKVERIAPNALGM